MAGRNSSRRTRPRVRNGGNRPRTHPKGIQRPGPKRKPALGPTIPLSDSTKVVFVLASMRVHLCVASAAATVVSKALKRQNADGDLDAALVLQRCVADELSRQIDGLDHLLANELNVGAGLKPSGGGS